MADATEVAAAEHLSVKAAIVEHFNASPVLGDLASPELADGEVLVAVDASSVNAMDVSVAGGMIEGRLPYELPITLGFDVAGTVVATGRGVTTLQVGDPVFGVHFKLPFHAGTWAEQVAVPVTQLAKRPDGLGAIAAGAIGLAGVAAKLAIDAVQPAPGETVLISGATGGVGAFAIQLAKAAGATVFATALSDQADYVRGLGADEAIDYTEEIGVEVRKAGADGVECIVHLAGDALSLAAVCLPGARFASTVGFGLEALEGSGLDLISVMATPSTEALEALGSAAAAGDLRVPITRAYPLDDVARALAEFKGSVGKLGITVSSS